MNHHSQKSMFALYRVSAWMLMATALVVLWSACLSRVQATQEIANAEQAVDEEVPKSKTSSPKSSPAEISSSNRSLVIVFSLTVFVLAIFVGFEVITKVPPTLHTPLMSGSNAISGITVIGAIIAAGNGQGGFGCFLGLVGIVLATINVVGGFVVTHRMLKMFKRK